MTSRLTFLLASAAMPVFFLACGGSSSTPATGSLSSAGTTTVNTVGTLDFSVSDASTEDWATIGVKILSVTLTPAGGGAAVPVYTAPATVPVTNLVQLDSLSDLLATASVPAGTYSGATLTLSANPGDVTLVVAADPEAGFAGTPGATIPSAQIQIQKAKGSTGSLTVPVAVSFASPVTVTASQTTPLDLEFVLSHPAFIVDHVPVDGSATLWAVSFNGPMVRHNPIADVTRVVLRHLYGTVASVTTDNTGMNITRDAPTVPPASPETFTATTDAITVLADSVNKTLFYDVDAKTVTPITDFSTVAATLPGKYVRVAARYQQDGSLVAVRVWASATFDSIWLSPEGHVLHTDVKTNPAAPTLTVATETGGSTVLTVDSSTNFFFRTPANAQADATPIATGTAFMTDGMLARGFKVHASVVDPTATPLVAQDVDIELARYDGDLSQPTATGFTDTRTFNTTNATDDYTVTLPFISAATANGKDSSGNVIDGFKWWNLAFPTLADTGTGAITDFASATGGSINFYTAASQAVPAWGATGCTWGDPAAPATWAAQWTVLEPVTLPLGSVGTAWAAGTTGGSFGMVVAKGANTVTVDLSTVNATITAASTPLTANSATLVYQVDKTSGVVTVTSQDITNPTTLANVVSYLGQVGTKVKVAGIPQANGTIKAYTVFYYTGTAPAQ